MKKLILMTSLISIIACKKETDNNEPTILDAVKSIDKLKDVGEAATDFEKRAEELKKMKPISNDILKNVLKEELSGLKRYGFNAGNTSMMNLSSAEGDYGDANGKNIKIAILDGAGETGSAMLTLIHMSLAASVENIQNTKTEKTEEFEGYKCMTTNDTDTNNPNASILFIHKDRFQITITGNKMNLDEVKDFMKSLDLSELN